MEAVEVTYDPCRISYEELLDVFWGMFPANIPPGPSRTRTAVFPQDAAQAAAAEDSKRSLQWRMRDRIYTRVVPEATFWPAERLHQKFNLQRVHPELVQELAAGWEDVDAFLTSTAATRLNAWVSGFADDAVLAEVADEVGWTVEDLHQRLYSPDHANSDRHLTPDPGRRRNGHSP